MEEIQIELSRNKILLLLLLGIVFFLISVILITKPSEFLNYKMRSEKLILIIGWVGFILFGIITMFLFIKLFDSKPGLVINKKGILDNTSTNPSGFIKWSDIISVVVKKSGYIQFILIKVKNPNEYIERSGRINRIALKQNTREHGTPLVLTSTSLKCSFEELKKYISENLPENVDSELSQ